MTTFEDKTGRRSSEVEESEEVARIVIVTSITAFLCCGDSFVYFVQQILGCGVAEEMWEDA